MKRTLVVAIMALVPIFVSADPSLECSSAGSQVEIGACVNEVGKTVDAALAFALEIAQGAATELDDMTGRNSAALALEVAQAAWAAYRDAHCDAVGTSFGGGSGTGIAIASCRIELGRERIRDLMHFGQ